MKPAISAFDFCSGWGAAMRFRPGLNEDGESVRELVFSVLAEYGLQPDPDSTDQDLFDLQGSYAHRGGCFELLVDDEDRLVGCYGLYPLGERIGELRKMYLRPEYRGRGLGKKILRRALARAAGLGLRRVQLETAKVLVEATALYESFGFREFQPDHISARCDRAFYLDLQ